MRAVSMVVVALLLGSAAGAAGQAVSARKADPSTGRARGEGRPQAATPRPRASTGGPVSITQPIDRSTPDSRFDDRRDHRRDGSRRYRRGYGYEDPFGVDLYPLRSGRGRDIYYGMDNGFGVEIGGVGLQDGVSFGYGGFDDGISFGGRPTRRVYSGRGGRYDYQDAVGTWWLDPLQADAPAEKADGPGVQELRIAEDGSFTWGASRDRIREIVPYFAKGGERFFSVRQSGRTYIAVIDADGAMRLQHETGEVIATGRRIK